MYLSNVYFRYFQVTIANSFSISRDFWRELQCARWWKHINFSLEQVLILLMQLVSPYYFTPELHRLKINIEQSLWSPVYQCNKYVQNIFLISLDFSERKINIKRCSLYFYQNLTTCVSYFEVQKQFIYLIYKEELVR